LHLKGGNRAVFTNALTRNLRERVGRDCTVTLSDGRYIFDGFKPEIENDLIARITSVFGLTSVSPCVVVRHSEILDYVKTIPVSGSFRVNVNRADKNFPHTSMTFPPIVGEAVLHANKSARVDLHAPEKTINIDIRTGDRAFIYDTVVPAFGGLPVGTAGKCLVLLSGGIDSPVAAFLAAKRGLTVECVHFSSPPYTSALAQDKVERLVAKLEQYCGKMKLHTISVTETLQKIKQKCHESYTITLLRRDMIRRAAALCAEREIDCIVTGENLAQVASQTIQGITTNNAVAGAVPILRPVITFDKTEIIEIARKIGTYEISVEPHADCCTVFVPASPIIAPTIAACEREEAKLL
jgi:thiamine biosynthesis protein ThiI